MEQPALQHLAASGALDLNAPASGIPFSSLYIALGLREQDPGYEDVTEAIASLGASTPLHEGLWHLQTNKSIKDIFRKVNTSMLDRRIDGDTGLLVLETGSATAQWYLRRPVSGILEAMWGQKNDLFISFTLHDSDANYESILQDLQALGDAIAIGKNIWYLSSAYSSKEAFQILIGRMDRGDQLLVFDSAGNRATWHDRLDRVALEVSPPSEQRPHRAVIHSLNPMFTADQANSA